MVARGQGGREEHSAQRRGHQQGVQVPRDRDGSFEPTIVAKRQRRLSGVEDLVLFRAVASPTTSRTGRAGRSAYARRAAGRLQPLPVDLLGQVAVLDPIYKYIPEIQAARLTGRD